MSLAKGRDETPILERPCDVIGDGTADVAVAGTAVQLSTTDTPCKYVEIFAKAANTGNVFVGGSTVSSTRGAVLEQARSIRLWIDNLNKVYIDCETGNTDGVMYVYTV